MNRCILTCLATVGGLAGIGATAAHAAGTTADAMIVSGFAGHYPGPQFACATSGPQALEAKYFGSASVGLPTEGYAYCGLAGGINSTSNATGASTAVESVNNFYSNGLHSQTAAATADFGLLKASSSGSYTGNAIGGFAYNDGDAAAYATDTLAAPTGAKFIQFGLTIDGTAAVTGNSEVLTILDYQIDGGIIYGAFHTTVTSSSSFTNGLNGTNSGDVAGFVGGPGSVSGSGTVTSFVSALSGPTFDLTLALLAAAYPAQGGGTATNDFADTARLSSLRFFDAAMNPVAFGTITGASGRMYSADGIVSATSGTPEPATWGLMIAGFGLVGATQRRRRTAAV